MRLGDVVDELHDQHGLADAGAAEEADLAALGVGREQIDDLDAGDEDLRLGRLLGVRSAPADGWRDARSSMGPASSTGSPMTLMMRPRVPSPTGTVIGAPVSRTAGRASGLRRRPWRCSAPVFSPRCWATSSTSRVAVVLGLQRIEDSGRWPSNFTSTTAPMTCVMWPVGCSFGISHARSLLSSMLKALRRRK